MMIDGAMEKSFLFCNQLLVVRTVREGIRTVPFQKVPAKILFINVVRMVIGDIPVHNFLL